MNVKSYLSIAGALALELDDNIITALSGFKK